MAIDRARRSERQQSGNEMPCVVCDRPLRTAYVLRDGRPRCWRHGALHPAVRRRALITAAIVGTVLTAINQGDRILRGDVDSEVALKVALTYCVPFAVSTSGALGAARVPVKE
jgi:hypothetical protein